VCLLASWPTRFESDPRRPEPAAVAVRAFFSDLRRVVCDRGALAPLLGLAALRGLAAAAVGALIAAVLDRQGGPGPEAAYRTLLTVALLTMAGAGLGSMLAGLLRDPRRALVLVPSGATGMAVALAWAAQAPTLPPVLCAAIGLLGGLVNVPLLVAYQSAVPPDARGNGMAILNTAGYLGIAALALGMAALSASGVLSASGQLLSVATLSGLAAAAAWRWLRPPPGGKRSKPLFDRGTCDSSGMTP
jgi:predicted MFS family arabinose efflux permease